MSKLYVQAMTGLSADVTVPNGKRARIVAVTAGLAGAADGNQVLLTFTRAPDQLFIIPSGALNVGSGALTFGLGLAETQNVIALIDPVAPGATQLATSMTNHAAPLPNIWLEWNITLTLAGTGLVTVTPVAIIYELEDA